MMQQKLDMILHSLLICVDRPRFQWGGLGVSLVKLLLQQRVEVKSRR